jgi:1,4-dihydroxy-6-naphthoate synthase
MKLTLGISPCPNDTFIFEALADGSLDTGPLRFEVVLEDVQTLNQWALAGRLDVTKISYGVLPQVASAYRLLDAGGALGRGVGPLLVARPGTGAFDPTDMRVAIPGEQTTANLLFSLAFPEARHRRYLLFSEIEAAVLRGEVDAGVIIHEGRFTYAARGLTRLLDLGEHWERRTGTPIPLGGIVVRRALGVALARDLDRLVRQSLERARARLPALSDWVRCHAQEMDEAVMRQHIALYVNDFSLGLGDEGRRAVERLLAIHRGLHPELPAPPPDLFLPG